VHHKMVQGVCGQDGKVITFHFLLLLEQMFSSHRIRAGILVVVLDTTSRIPLPSKLPVGRAMRSFLVFGTLCIINMTVY
jgi:hypothetical protein